MFSSQSLALLVLGIPCATSALVRVTPVEKVVGLLRSLKDEVEKEGKAEASSYAAYACFCKDTTATKTTSIGSSKDDIDLTSAKLGESTANRIEKQGELKDAKVKREEIAAELQKTEERCTKDIDRFEGENADLTKAVFSLESALTSMQNSKPAAAFLAVKATSQRMKGLGALAALLQRAGSAVDPRDPEYKFHSQDIVDTVTELLEDFKKKEAMNNEEWAKTKKVCDATKKTWSDEQDTNKANIEALKLSINELAEKIASFRENLVRSQSLLKDDQLYLKDLTDQCESRAKDFDQRTQLRSGELKALSSALDLLSNKVAAADASANERALLQTSPSFLQSSVIERHSMTRVRQERAADFLRAEGVRLGSVALSSIAVRSAADPFGKVKTLIQGLVERLLSEANAEASKKGFCDTEMAKAIQDRDFRRESANKLNAELRTLEAKSGALKEQNDELGQQVGRLDGALNQSAEVRNEEKAANLATLKEAKEGLRAVNDALAILKDFYKQAAKATVALVQKASPVDEDTKGPGFDSAYKGKQAASKGIIGTLEVIQSDFERTISTTKASEKKSSADHVEFDRANKVDATGKSKKEELNAEDLAKTKTTIESKMNELQTAMNLVDNALALLEELKPTCVDMTMSSEDRVKKRDEEVAALKRALCMLDPEMVEEICA